MPLQATVNKDPSQIILNQQSELSHVARNNRSHDETSMSMLSAQPTSSVQQVAPIMVPNEVPPIMVLNQPPSIAPSQEEPITSSDHNSSSASTHASANLSDQVPLNVSNHDSLNISDRNPSIPINAPVSANATLPPTTASPNVSDLTIARRVSRALKAILLMVLVAWIVAIGYPNVSGESISILKQALDRFLPLLTQPSTVENAQFLEPTMALATQPTVIVHDPEKARLLEPAAMLASKRDMEELHLRATSITQAMACMHVPSPTGSPAISIVVCTIMETITVTATQSVTITERPTVLPDPASPLKLTSPETAKSSSSTYFIFCCSLLLFSFRFQILGLLPYINKLYQYMCRLLRYAYCLLHYMFCLFAQLTSPAEYNETSLVKALEFNERIMKEDSETEKTDEELEVVDIKEDPDSKI